MGIFKKEKEDPQNLKEAVNCLKKLEKKTDQLESELKALQEDHKFSLKKIGIKRYNPFSESGGDQSFSIALLDDSDNGVVITSIYAREVNRMYAKPVKAGQSEYSLSSEEKFAIDSAKSKK